MSTKPKAIFDALTSTMRIKPDEYTPLVSDNRVTSLGYALAGWLYMLRHQKNTRLMSVASVGVLLVAVWLEVDAVGFALLTLAITIVWMAEFLNAAVEAVINLATAEWHPMAKVGKDVAAAAVLLSVIAAVIVGLLVMGSPLLDKLRGL